MNTFEKQLSSKIITCCEQGKLDLVTPGLQIQVYSKGKKKADLNMGKTYPYYDLASLTKILFTVSAFVRLVDQKKIHLNKSVSSYLDWWQEDTVTAKKLLTHTAGMPWWKPLYKNKVASNWQEGRGYLKKRLQKMKPDFTGKAVYSDPDFWLLGFLIEELFEKDLLQVWQEIRSDLKLDSLHFNVNNKPKYKRALYAPTERCPWRNKVLKGEVHDDNTWALKGVCTHAGLFGSVSDLSKWGLELRKGLYSQKGSKLGSQKTLMQFCKRQTPKKVGDWGLGFMMAANELGGGGKFLSAQSVGHTGFTGTSFWFDPKNDLLISVVSNRVHPTRDNRKFVTLRKDIHRLVSALI